MGQRGKYSTGGLNYPRDPNQLPPVARLDLAAQIRFESCPTVNRAIWRHFHAIARGPTPWGERQGLSAAPLCTNASRHAHAPGENVAQDSSSAREIGLPRAGGESAKLQDATAGLDRSQRWHR